MRRDDGFCSLAGQGPIAAFERMIDALSSTQEIETHETASELTTKARTFAGIAAPASPFEPPAGVASTEPVLGARWEWHRTGFGNPGWPAGFAEAGSGAVPMGRSARSELANRALAKNTTTRTGDAGSCGSGTCETCVVEVVASFLGRSQHSFGEFGRGLLVVVCSIGLVVSLWSTLTRPHRVSSVVDFHVG